MDTLRNFENFNEWDDSDDVTIQCLSWNGDNAFIEDNTNSKKVVRNLEHTIRIYGVDKMGHSVSVNVLKFKPYFYIKVEDDCSAKEKTAIMRSIKESMKPFIADGILNAEFVYKKEFYGFTNKKDFKFIKFTFLNLISMKKCERAIKDGIQIGKEKKQYKLYESNILPFMRFMHEKGLDAAGWIKIPGGNYTLNELKKTNCQIDIEVEWDQVEFYQNKIMSPFLIASYDIECNSSHGDFPLPIKNYKKLGYEIYDNFNTFVKNNKSESLTSSIKCEVLNKLLCDAFSADKPIYNKKLLSKLNLFNIDISPVFTKGNQKPITGIYSIIAKKVFGVIDRRETYKIIALDIIRNLEHGIKDFNNERQIKERVKDLIDDAFSDDPMKKDFGNAVQTIYTKVNRKPNQRIILDVSRKISKNIKSLFKKIKTILDIDDSDIHYILNVFSKMEAFPRDDISNKIREEYEIDESDAVILLTYIQQCTNAILSMSEEEFPEIDDSRVTYCNRITELLDNGLPAIEGDRVVQIGTTVQRFGESGCFLKHIITLNGCTPIEGAVVESYDTEEEVLLAWTRFMQELDPDIITGYNIFGFDFSFMWDRAEQLGIVDEFSLLGREKHQPKDEEGKRQKEWVTKPSHLELKRLASSALGDNTLKYISMEGRVMVDLLKVVQKDFNLVSYKLDSVAEHFINDKITRIEGNRLYVSGIQTLARGNYITINIGKDERFKDRKFKIVDINESENWIALEDTITDPESFIQKKPRWTLAKDDVSPKEIFELQEGSDDDRRRVAVYCIQDCALCITLMEKLKLITNNIGMANVCFVPISFLFLRGQGIKIFSLVSKECRDAGYVIPVMKHSNDEEQISRDCFNNKDEVVYEMGEDDTLPAPENDGGYEGAIVLEPNPGIYLKKPVTVLDYSSLYPSSMISENLSHDSYVMDDNPDNEPYLGDEGIETLETLGYDVVDMEYDVFEWVDSRKKSKGKKKVGKKMCRFAQPKDGTKSIIPNILRKLLKARKSTRKLITFQTFTLDDGRDISGNASSVDKDGIIKVLGKDGVSIAIKESSVTSTKKTYSEFEQAVFDGLQLAYKLTANSLYGQIGAKTSPIYMKDIAASTTATGRQLLYLAKEKVEEKFAGSKIVYGDTDSIFIDFNPTEDGREGLKQSIQMGLEAEEYIQQFLKPPHKLEYEKTFWPFILFSKKRYIGNKYEFKTGENDYKETSMGIVLKRRDNADIVKHAYGGVIDILMNQKNVELSITYLKGELQKLLDGRFPMEMLIITKSLRGFYKNPQQIAHKVLADRIGVRDPGNKPKSNDRIPYVYIETKEKHKLQGDRIETPEYIKEQDLKPDYMFYITNQIMKPVAQIYSLIVENLDGFKYKPDYYKTKYRSLLGSKTPEKAREKIQNMRFDDTCDIVFGDIIRIAENRKNKATTITDFFNVVKKT